MSSLTPQSSAVHTDVNANGTINASDAAIVKSQVGMAIPIPLENAKSAAELKTAR